MPCIEISFDFFLLILVENCRIGHFFVQYRKTAKIRRAKKLYMSTREDVSAASRKQQSHSQMAVGLLF